jgi:glycine/sarcosine N-methyltransferase
MDQYDSMGWLYEVLYADQELDQLGRFFLEEHESLIKRSTNSRIRDVSCGNGIQAIALCRAGHNVRASDKSLEMIRLARRNAEKMKVPLDVFQAEWKELPTESEEPCSLLLCQGNSICHTSSRVDRKAVLDHFYRMLEPGGTILLDSRNWEKLIRKEEEYSILRKREYNTKTYIPIYLWQGIELEKDSSVRIVFIELSANQQQEHEVILHFVPFSHECLREDCLDVGYTISVDTYDSETDFYYLYLQK